MDQKYIYGNLGLRVLSITPGGIILISPINRCSLRIGRLLPIEGNNSSDISVKTHRLCLGILYLEFESILDDIILILDRLLLTASN